VCTQQPFPIGSDLEGADGVRAITDSMRVTVAVNNLGLPAVAVPVGVANGLPQGVQVIGPRYREDLCLDAGEAIEMNREFQGYLTHYGETQKVALEILERLAAREAEKA